MLSGEIDPGLAPRRLPSTCSAAYALLARWDGGMTPCVKVWRTHTITSPWCYTRSYWICRYPHEIHKIKQANKAGDTRLSGSPRIKSLFAQIGLVNGGTKDGLGSMIPRKETNRTLPQVVFLNWTLPGYGGPALDLLHYPIYRAAFLSCIVPHNTVPCWFVLHCDALYRAVSNALYRTCGLPSTRQLGMLPKHGHHQRHKLPP